MKKKCLVFVVLIVLLVSFQAVSAEANHTKEADMLNSLGLFNGTQNGYELDRVPTRVEAAAMLVRLLGAEKEANEMKYEHPFTDVPEWANNIVGYMYEKGFTQGIGNNLFGSSQTTIARDFTTFMLRSLGYSSSSDFNYLESLNFAAENGIISTEEAAVLNSNQFKRNEMVMLSYKTLNANLKDNDDKLATKLYDNGVLNKQEAFKQGLVKIFETTVKDIDTSSDKFEVNTPVTYIYAEKQEIDNGDIIGFDMDRKEYFIDGYAGSIGFKKGLGNWGENIKFEISFYNEGEFVKEIDYLTFKYDGLDDEWAEFFTPYDKFDEIRIRAYPINMNDVYNEMDGILEIISTKNSKALKEEISKYGNVHATSYGDSRIDFNSEHDINIIAWKVAFNGKTKYPDGTLYKPHANKYIVDGNFTLEFDNEGSSINSDRIITLPKNNMTESINFVLIFDEGFNIEKLYIVK